MNFRQIKAIEQANKQKLIKHFGAIPETSGIYVLTRQDENGFKYAYIGQAKHILTRLAQHLNGYQHIDLSLKKHGLFNSNNRYGYRLEWVAYTLEELDRQEQDYIKSYANAGYQLRNKTTGSQGKGKTGIDEFKAAKGYYDGVKYGYQKAIKEVRQYFDKYLDFAIKGKTNKIKERKFNEFKRWIYEEEHEGNS